MNSRITALVCLCLIVGLSLPTTLWARYARPQLAETPVARLIENLSAIVAKNPKDAQSRYNLARLYGMAYAQKSETLQARIDGDSKGPWFGYEPKFVPFEPQATADEAKLKQAQENLAKAISTYQETIKLDPKLLAARLGYAWCLEQAGKKAEAVAEYRKVIEQGWEQEKKLEAGGLGGHYITAEAADYLKPLLDPEKDKTEIAELEKKSAQLRALPRPITPLVIPLQSGLNAAALEDRAAQVDFDLDGTGKKVWSWITPQAGWLVYDHAQEGRINSGLQLFGNVTFWCFWDHGYHTLAALDNNTDGQLSGTELDKLAIWRDVNGNGVSEPGEVRSLAYHGIVALGCRSEALAAHPDQIQHALQGVTFASGETRPTFDLILRPQASDPTK